MNVKKLFDYSQPLVAAATVLSAGAIICAVLGTYAAYKIKISDDTVVVTGSAKETVRADHVRWTINLETKTGVSGQQVGVNTLEAARKKIFAYLEEKGYTSVESPVASVYPQYAYPERSEPVFTGYTVSRSITVLSDDVDGISELANNMAPLSGAGYTTSIGGLEFTYAKLDEARVRLLSLAIKDAKARASAIAQETGRDVDVLRSASSGVVQVLPAGGVEISDYGSYDTQSIMKDVMVTVRADFSLK